MKAYTVLLAWDPEEGIFDVSVPALPGLHTWGESRTIALERARDAIRLYLEDVLAAGEPLPEESLLQMETVRVET